MIGHMAGLENRDPWALARQIEKGLPWRAFVELHRELGVSQEEAAAVIRVPVRTLARRRQSRRFAPEESERLVRVRQILETARELFVDDREAMQVWMVQPNPGLNAQSPLAACRTEIGAREVESLIGRLRHGVVS